MNRFSLEPLTRAEGEYDTFFGSSGAEQRSTHIWKRDHPIARERYALFYERDSNTVAAKNHRFFKAARFRSIDLTGVGLRDKVGEIISSSASTNGSHRRICIDISCLTREALARWVHCALSMQLANSIEIDFLYSHAVFSPPPVTCGLAKSPTPIIPELAGFFPDHNRPSLLIIGLGYEPHLALSFWERLDPGKVIAFVPTHHDQKYADAIEAQNRTFLSYVKRDALIPYNVFDGLSAFNSLQSVIAGSIDSFRVNIAPYGPKLFVLCSLFAACVVHPRVFVWHLNSEVPVVPAADRVASGSVSGVRLRVFSADSLNGGQIPSVRPN